MSHLASHTGVWLEYLPAAQLLSEAINGKAGGIGQPAEWSFKRTRTVPDKNPSECGSGALGVGGGAGKSQREHDEGGVPSSWKDPSNLRVCTGRAVSVSAQSCAWPWSTSAAGLRNRARPEPPRQLSASASHSQLFLPSSKKPFSPTSSSLLCCLLPSPS